MSNTAIAVPDVPPFVLPRAHAERPPREAISPRRPGSVHSWAKEAVLLVGAVYVSDRHPGYRHPVRLCREWPAAPGKLDVERALVTAFQNPLAIAPDQLQESSGLRSVRPSGLM